MSPKPGIGPYPRLCRHNHSISPFDAGVKDPIDLVRVTLATVRSLDRAARRGSLPGGNRIYPARFPHAKFFATWTMVHELLNLSEAWTDRQYHVLGSLWHVNQ